MQKLTDLQLDMLISNYEMMGKNKSIHNQEIYDALLELKQYRNSEKLYAEYYDEQSRS